MIVVKIELWPKGLPTNRRCLGVMTISNIGGSATVGKYEAELFKALPVANNPTPDTTEPRLQKWRTFEIGGFRRKRFGAWYLLAGILQLMDFEKAFQGDVR